MNKTKSQLRAEAVERLKKLNCMDVDCYQLLEATVDDAGEKVGYRVEIRKLIDLLTPDTHEARGSYEERLHDVPVSDCPYCGCKRVVIHDFSDIYENPHSYRVEHVDEKEAFNAGCFETYYAFNSVEKAVEHANMRDTLTDDKLPEGDVAAILRKAASYDGDYSGPGEALRRLTDSTTVYYALETLADMIERDYVIREVYEDLRDEFTWETTFLHRMGKKCGTKDVPSLVAYVDKLESRVEELEAVDRRIAETDSRWEAAIRDLERMTAERDELQKQLDAVSAPSGNLDAQSRAEIEDAERSANAAESHGDAQRAVLSADTDSDKGEGAKDAQDTREKLEEDVRTYMFPWRVDMALDWLDRQESITERHWMEICGANANANIELKRQIDVLEANNAQLHTIVSELKADNDHLRDINEKLGYEVRDWKGEAKTQRNNFYQATEARKHWQRKYENLKATSYSAEAPSDESELARELGKALAERDMYREKLGESVDAAQQIVKLMEEEQ